jgi:hypothetical protein
MVARIALLPPALRPPDVSPLRPTDLSVITSDIKLIDYVASRTSDFTFIPGR